MTILSDSNLETMDYDVPGWVHIYNENIDRLNDILLKIDGLLDVVTSTPPKDGAVLCWNATTSNWRAVRFKQG